MKRLLLWVTGLLLASWGAAGAAESNHNFAKWEKEISAFEQMDRTNPPPKGAVLFIGSSTIRLWSTLAQDFPDQHVLNRGFGGSQIVDATHFAERIIFPYAPRTIFLRAGVNDLFEGKTPEQVFADFKAFVATVHAKLPQTDIVYISLSPSVARWAQAGQEQALNTAVEHFARTTPHVRYLDATSVSLGPDGRPRPELFRADKLHFNAAGYQALAARVRAEQPVRFALVGLNHDHAAGFLSRLKEHPEAQLVGIVETNPALVAGFAKRYQLNPHLFCGSLKALLARTNVQAVALFTSTFDHRRWVEACADCGIHTVMMEKPLAVNLKHARAIEQAAKRGRLQIIVNYETTWYPANQAAFKLVHDEHAIGELRKIVVHDGHRGPREIGCSAAFLAWLTDPALNGGGALPDFGCYGADLMTWLMDGQRPTSVFAVTQQLKPEVYPKVEDEATLVLTYPKAQGIIQASWNWPFDRKDMEVYGQTGYVLVPRKDQLRVRTANTAETEVAPPPLSGAQADSLAYLAAVARGTVKPSGLSSLELNLVVTEILDAARDSARTGKRIRLR